MWNVGNNQHLIWTRWRLDSSIVRSGSRKRHSEPREFRHRQRKGVKHGSAAGGMSWRLASNSAGTSPQSTRGKDRAATTGCRGLAIHTQTQWVYVLHGRDGGLMHMDIWGRVIFLPGFLGWLGLPVCALTYYLLLPKTASTHGCLPLCCMLNKLSKRGGDGISHRRGVHWWWAPTSPTSSSQQDLPGCILWTWVNSFQNFGQWWRRRIWAWKQIPRCAGIAGSLIY